MIQSKSEKIYLLIIYILLGIIAFVTVYPFIYVLSASLSSGDAVATGKVLLLPTEVTFEAYRRVLFEPGLWSGYANTIYYTIVGTIVNLALTTCGAYALSKKRLMGGKFISFMVALTLWFKPGMIPMYLNFRSLHLLDTRTAIIWGFGITAFNVILLRTFFQSVPSSLEEAAKIDGATEWHILKNVYLPLSKPALATIGLFYGVNRWNGYFWSMILLRDKSKLPLQVLLKSWIVEMNIAEDLAGTDVAVSFSQQTFIYATIIVSIIPIIIVYPYIQKFFVKGVMIGSVKG